MQSYGIDVNAELRIEKVWIRTWPVLQQIQHEPEPRMIRQGKAAGRES